MQLFIDCELLEMENDSLSVFEIGRGTNNGIEDGL